MSLSIISGLGLCSLAATGQAGIGGHLGRPFLNMHRRLVLYAARQVTGGVDFDPAMDTPKGIWFVSSWAFVLRPIGKEQTRLLVRLRVIGGPAWMFLFLRLILGLGDRVAHSSMFERIKTRAEAYDKQRESISI